jgi:hypothetical protein
MATAGEASKVSAPVPHSGDHDRVSMLSLKADGTADQHNPEIIGDKDAAVEAAKRQFAEQAVSAVDVAERGASSGPVTLVGQEDGSVKEEPLRTDSDDPSVEALRKKHESAAKSAESAAESTIKSLSKS